MSTQKTISKAEADLIGWFTGQVGVVESNGQRVEKLMLQLDRTQGDFVTIDLVYAPVAVPAPEDSQAPPEA